MTIKQHTTHFKECDCFMRISEHERIIKEKDQEIANAKKTIERDEALRTEYHREITAQQERIKELESRVEDLNDEK